MPAPSFSPRWPLAAALCVAALTARAQESYDRQVAEAVPKVEAALGRRFKQPPHLEVRTRQEMRALLTRMLQEEGNARILTSEQSVYRRLGIIPDTLDWSALQLELLAEQVVGFYDPHTKVLYLESDAEEQALGIVIPHELVHALQDQYLNLDSIEHLQGEDDRVRAAEAVMEGQATLIAFEIALGFGSEFPGGADAIRESVREERSEQPVMASAPLFVRELQTFPYLSGLEFMARSERERPGAIPFDAELPASSAQIVHPDLYFSAPRRGPLTVRFPAPAGAVLAYDNVMGEFATRIFLQQLLGDKKRAKRASEGWSGDRIALVKSAAGDGIVWLSIWNSPRDANEFAEAMRRVVAKRYRKPASRADAGSTSYTAGERIVTVGVGLVAGRPTVWYLDLPAGDDVRFDPASARVE
jgi:hypothetical protein